MSQPRLHPIIQALLDAGIIPPHCTDLEILMKCGAPPRIRAEVLVTDAALHQIADALLRDPAEARRLTEYLVRGQEHGDNGPTVTVPILEPKGNNA